MKLDAMWNVAVVVFGAIGGLSGVVAVTRVLFPKFYDKNVDPYFVRYAPTVAGRVEAQLVRKEGVRLTRLGQGGYRLDVTCRF